jgi:alkylation response protein AidB-like acyl-CoA dehydrogenase
VELQLTAEQGMLAEAAAELVARRSSDDGIVGAGESARLWGDLVEFGALGAGEDALGTVDLALLARALGERLATAPLVDSAALLLVAGPELGDALRVPAALGLGEPGRSFAPIAPSTGLDGLRLTGAKSAVVHADTVQLLAVTAAASDGVALALVPATAPGLELEPEPTLDPVSHPFTVTLDDAEAEHVHADESTAALVERLAATAAVLAAAEAVGAAATVLGLARDYAAGRHQFGHTIGSFQAVRHLLADMVVLTESAWSSVLYAAASLDETTPDCLQTAAIAKAWASRGTLEVAHGALQVFGGIAFTEDHPAHRYLRRIASLGSRYGSAAEHERELGRALAHPLEVST